MAEIETIMYNFINTFIFSIEFRIVEIVVIIKIRQKCLDRINVFN